MENENKGLVPGRGRTMDPEEQLKRWVDGESVHNGDPKDPESECCPDFSCCNPASLWPKEKREAYYQADPTTRESMCVGGMMTALGGKVEEVGSLPDGSGFATASFHLPEDHWLYQQEMTSVGPFNIPPMPFRMGYGHPNRKRLEEALRAAGQYAVRCATMNGKLDDYDPDALIQNLIVGFLGYHTEDGLSDDEWANPEEVFNAKG